MQKVISQQNAKAHATCSVQDTHNLAQKIWYQRKGRIE